MQVIELFSEPRLFKANRFFELAIFYSAYGDAKPITIKLHALHSKSIVQDFAISLDRRPPLST